MKNHISEVVNYALFPLFQLSGSNLIPEDDICWAARAVGVECPFPIVEGQPIGELIKEIFKISDFFNKI